MRQRLDALIQSLRGAWVRQGVWTVLDQALFAGANFAVNVALARWLDPAGYGAYTVAYTIFLLLGTVHAGYLVEPMLVFGAGRFRGRLAAYLRVLLGAHGRFALAFAALLGLGAAGAWAAGEPTLALALSAFAVGQAAILFQWAMRSACYVRTEPRLAAATGVLYAALMVGGLGALQAAGLLSVATAVGLVSGASLAAGAVIANRLNVPLRRPGDGELTREAAREHRRYGGWAASTGALEWFHGFLPLLLLPLWGGLAAAGALRALYNLVLPVLHVFHALAKLLVPVFVRARERGEGDVLALRVGVGLVAASAVYALAVWAVGAEVLHVVYGGRYDAWAHHLWVVAVVPVGLAVSNVAQALLRAAERPQSVFAARAAASGVAATAGAALVAAFGVAGALLSELLTALAETAVMLALLVRGGREPVTSGGLPGPGGDGAGRRRVLLIAFACGPGRGSEPGQGWAFAHGLARECDVTALVYAGFKRAIDRELAERPVPGLRVVYYRLPFERARHWARGEDRAGFAEQAHYHGWQTGAGWLARRLHREAPFDLVHHVSFMRYWSPSAGRAVDAPFLWGPVGGGESAPRAFYPALSPPGRRAERTRDLARWASSRLPSVRRTARHADLALATTPESASALGRLGASRVETAPASLALGADALRQLGALPAPTSGPVRFVSVGRLLAWKGTALALRAFARALDDAALADAELWVVGDGPERGRLEREAAALGVAGHVRFLGRVPRDEALQILGHAHALIHPSLHDSGGYAVLEALAAGRPVVCLDLGGPGLVVTPETGVVVPAHAPEQAEAGLAAALRLLASDPDLRARMGAAGRARVGERFTWGAVLRDTLGHYAALAGDAGEPFPSPAGAGRQRGGAGPQPSPPPGQGESPPASAGAGSGEGVDPDERNALVGLRAHPVYHP